MFGRSRTNSLDAAFPKVAEPQRIARLQGAQLTLYRLQKRESVGENVVIDRTIAEIEVSRLSDRISSCRMLMFA